MKSPSSRLAAVNLMPSSSLQTSWSAITWHLWLGIQMNRSIIKARTFRLFLPGTGSWGKGFPTLRRPRVSSRLCTRVRYPDSPFPHNPPYGAMGLRLLFCLSLSIALANSLDDRCLTSVYMNIIHRLVWACPEICYICNLHSRQLPNELNINCWFLRK